MAKTKEAAFFISQKAVAELVGTYILVFFGCGSAFMEQRGNITLAGAALTWACAMGAVIYTIGHVSGAHINPAVTVAFASVGLFPWKQVPLYVMAQSLGSILASLTLQWLFGSGGASLMLTLPAGPNPAGDLNIMAWEIIVTFVLLLVICSSALDPRAAKGFGGIAIGGAVFINVTIAGPISGCSMNPARSFGPAVVNHNFRKLWIYIVSPVIGAVAGALLYCFLRIRKETETDSTKKDAFFSGDTEPAHHHNPTSSASEKSMEIL